MRMDAATHQNIRPYFFHALQPKGAMKHASGLRRHHRDRRRAAAEGIRGLQGHRPLLN
jgi:hypothetical protein